MGKTKAQKAEPNKGKLLSIRGAKLHNLKDVSVDIPHNSLAVITGVSGSGKSTLAFDTLYAEGQRRFVESLSSYARQFLERLAKPDVESITGLPPAIAIEQNTPSKNPRSTVGTSTEVYDYLRVLYARIGQTICTCGKPVRKDTPQLVVDDLMKLSDGEKIHILFQLPQIAKSAKENIESIKKLGYFRLMLAGSDDIIEGEGFKPTKDTNPSDIFVLADRAIIRHTDETVTRITDSIEAAFRAGNGRIFVLIGSTGERRRFSTVYECNDCEIIFQEPQPKLFSFNNPYGACHNCQGFGRTIDIDEALVVPDRTKSIKNNAISPYRTPTGQPYMRDLIRACNRAGIPIDVPYSKLTDEQKAIVWEGDGTYEGIRGYFKDLEEKNYKIQNRILISRYRGFTTCPKCGGSRLRSSARQVFIRGVNIPKLVKMPLDDVFVFFKNLELSDYETQVAGTLVKEITWRLDLLTEIGVGYLTLDRLSHTLSGGESQRINLSTALGSSLVGTLYVLDEPSIGLHPRDTERLLGILFKLRNLGNTVVVVEHDPDIIKRSDYLIDLGPKAGRHGGNLMYAGPTADLYSAQGSLTADYITGKKQIPLPKERLKPTSKKIIIEEPRKHNLRVDRVEFPIGLITVVTGVSGSGKSTLVRDVLHRAMTHADSNTDEGTLYEKLIGREHIVNVEMVDQSSIGKSSRSTPITYTKGFDLIRELFADTQASRQMGYKSGYFSFNVPGGRCDVCEGEGTVTVDMQFLPDVHLECEACKGTRYKKETRSILFNGKSIVDVLAMTVDEALEFFKLENKLSKKLQILHDVGLGYLQLGQPSSMLSGGEAQRIKLATHLDTFSSEPTLFIFDEPTTGLHLDDISTLLDCFRRLTDKGHTVVIIEHNLHVIAAADWVIDLGPEAGAKGGEIIAKGTPEQIAQAPNSLTGRALAEFFKNTSGSRIAAD